MFNRKQLIILTAALTLALAGCGKATTSPAASSATPAASAAASTTNVTAKDGAAALLKTVNQLKGQVDQKNVSDSKKQSAALEDQWGSFEDEVKSKYPDLYEKVEKYLDPLKAGLQQDKLDYDLIRQLTDGLKGTVTELSTSLNK